MPNTTNISTRPWIEHGYLSFGSNGPKTLKVEQIAKAVHISKSSFYHHFADMEMFEQELMNQHVRQAHLLVSRVKACQTFVPDFLELMLEMKPFVYFNRQLLIHKDDPKYLQCFQQANGILQPEFLDIWADMLSLSDKRDSANTILSIVVQLFYQRVPTVDFDYAWALAFVEEVKLFLAEVLRANNATAKF